MNMGGGHKTAFLIGYYGRHNLGDDLMCRALAGHLLRTTDWNLIIFADNGAAFADLSGPRVRTASRNLSATFRAIWQSDIVIQGGGTIFHDSYRGAFTLARFWAKLSLWISIFVAARIVGKRVYLLGSGLLPQRHALTRFMTSCALKLANGVVVRDSASFAFAKGRVPGDRLALGGDLATLIDLPAGEPSNTEPYTCKVVVSLCDLQEFSRQADFSSRYWDTLAQAINQWTNGRGKAQVSILNFYTLGSRGDGPTSRQFAARLNRSIDVEILDYEDNVDAFVCRIAAADLFIAARFHASILGALTGAPTIMIAYNRKTSDFAEDLGVTADAVAHIGQIVPNGDWVSRFQNARRIAPSKVQHIRSTMKKAISLVIHDFPSRENII